MPPALQIALGALLVAGVLGGITSGAFLLGALVARRRRSHVAAGLLRRAGQLPITLGLLAIAYPTLSLLLGRTFTTGSWMLVAGGLLLIALGLALLRIRPS